jgi:Zn ribbon nucleic-acid-binding protein
MFLLKEKWLCENTVISILYYVEYFRHKFTRACAIEHDNLKQSQDKMKHWYENKVIVVMLIHCLSLQAKYCWPYVIETRLNTHTNRKKRQICQVITQGFSKEYKLTVDASDVGLGSGLFQEGKDDIDLPNCYIFLKH